MNRFLWLLLTIAVALVVVPFGIANRHMVVVTFDPVTRLQSALAYEMPLSLLLFVTFMAGLVAGGLVMWLSQGRWRQTARLRTREAYQWKSEAARLTRERDEAAAKALPASGQRAA